MRFILSALIVLNFTVMAAAQDLSTAVKGLDASIQRVTLQTKQGGGTCSCVVFDITPDGRAHALTAAHCVDHEDINITVSGRSARSMISNRILDLAIVQFRPASGTQTIVLAPTTPPAGSATIAAGYAFGVEEIVYQFGHIAQPYNRETKSLWLNMDIIFGDSGGAILDSQGRLVGVTSAIFSNGPAHIGIAVPIESVHDFIEEYRDQLKKEQK